MHILYLHQHFALPSGMTATRSYEMARRWVSAGHQVTVICGRGDICGLPPESSFSVEGVCVRVVGALYSQKQSFGRRVWAFFCFMAAAFVQGLRVRNVDIIYATSTPLTIGIPAMLLKWFKRRPFVFEVRDQWPEVPIQMGYIRNPVLKALLLRLERCIYRSAAGIVALSPGMAEGIRNVPGADAKPILVAPNSADLELFGPAVDGAAFRENAGWQDKFVVLHFGAMGKVNALEFLTEAARELLPRCPDILFVLMGQGNQRPFLVETIETMKLSNVQIHDPLPKNRLPAAVAACDVSTIIIGNYPIIEHNSANKFFDSLAAGKPVLLNYSGWQREIIESHEAGLGCRLCAMDEYLENLLTLYRDKARREQIGRNARMLAEKAYSRDVIAQQVRQFLEDRL